MTWLWLRLAFQGSWKFFVGTVRAAISGRDDPSLPTSPKHGARRSTPCRAELAASININHALGAAPDQVGMGRSPVVIGRPGRRPRRTQNTPIVATFPARTFSRAPLYHRRAGNAAERAATAARRRR